MGLSCCFDSDNERWAVFRETTARARKQHKCYECRTIIKIGELYEYTFSVYDGDVGIFHICEKCADLRESLEELGFCTEYGSLLDDHAEYIAEHT